MNFGAFFPLTHFLSHLLSRDVFSALGSEAKTNAVTLIGHAHLDDALFSLLAAFLAADDHQSHQLAWETIFFRWNSTHRGEDDDDDDDVALFALTLAVFRRFSYEEALSSIEKRFGVYFVKIDGGRTIEWPNLFHTVGTERPCG